MLMFAIGFISAWVALAVLAFVSSEYGDQAVTLFDGISSTILTLPLLPLFAIVKYIVGPIYRKIKKKK